MILIKLCLRQERNLSPGIKILRMGRIQSKIRISKLITKCVRLKFLIAQLRTVWVIVEAAYWLLSCLVIAHVGIDRGKGFKICIVRLIFSIFRKYIECIHNCSYGNISTLLLNLNLKFSLSLRFKILQRTFKFVVSVLWFLFFDDNFYLGFGLRFISINIFNAWHLKLSAFIGYFILIFVNRNSTGLLLDRTCLTRACCQHFQHEITITKVESFLHMNFIIKYQY